MTDTVTYYPDQKKAFFGALFPLVGGMLMVLFFSLLAQSYFDLWGKLFFIFLIFIGAGIVVTTISNNLNRRIVVTKSELIDHWGLLRESSVYERKTIVTCMLQRDELKGVSIEGGGKRLSLYDSKHQEIGRLNVGAFHDKDIRELNFQLTGNHELHTSTAMRF